MLGWSLIALAGAVVCTVCDHLHATNDVLSYPHVFVWNQSWWVPLLFAGAAVVITANAGVIRKLFGARQLEAPTARDIVSDGISFVTAYAFTAYAQILPNVIAGVLFMWWLARVLKGAPAWLVVYSVLVGIGGTLFEAGWSALGFFHYNHPDMIGVPRWLPGIYLQVAFLTAGLERLVSTKRTQA
jgi:hypothetical protein